MAEAGGTYAPTPLLSILREALRERLRARVEAEIGPLSAAADGLRVERRNQARALASLRDRLDGLEALGGDFHPDMTVHAAWRRHPGVARVFARYGLPDCLSCSVGVDESLAEAAEGYDLPPEQLLAELQALLRG